MLDIKFIRENPELIKKAAATKNQAVDIDQIIKLDQQRRDIIGEVESLKAKRNTATAEIAKKKKAGEDAEEAIVAMREVGQLISAQDENLRKVDSQLLDLRSWLPNIPHESVPVGDESANRIEREIGPLPEFDFEPKPHWELGEALDILDLKAATRISGAGFHILKGWGAKLQRALINFMLDLHVSDGFLEVTAPHLVSEDSLRGTGQLPKMEEDMYRTATDGYYLIPTAEVPLTNMFKGEILAADKLPLSFVAHTPCYRREAGAAGKDTRGMTRLHQFDKVEMVQIVPPEQSYEALEKLTAQAEKVVAALELPYRVATLATGDLSFASAKTYDIELWSPGVKAWLEVSSISNFEDFQSRRMNLRFKGDDKRTHFPHTLNGSGTALPRLMIAVMENYQAADGTIRIPKVLAPYLGSADKIS